MRHTGNATWFMIMWKPLAIATALITVFLLIFPTWSSAAIYNWANVNAVDGQPAVELDSWSTEWKNELRVIHALTTARDGDLSGAENQLRMVLQSGHEQYERSRLWMFHLVTILNKQGKFAEAGDIWRQSGLVSVPAEFCAFLLQDRNLELASEWCRGLVEITPDGRNYCLRAEFLRRSQQHLDAEQDFQAAIEAGDAPPECLFNYGRLLYGQQRYEEALLAFEQAAERDPQTLYLVELGNALYRLDQLERALTVLMTAYAQSTAPQDRALSAATLGTILYQSGDYLAAKRYVEEGISLSERPDPSVYRALARIERQRGEHEKAITAYQNAIEGLGANPDPIFLAYRHELAKYLIELGRLEEARSVYQEILRIAPDNSEALEALE